jgi:predicted ATPase
MAKLSRLEIHGFKSIRHLPGMDLANLNVLIGANGTGKSNFISFFRMLSWITAQPGNMQMFVQRYGGANAHLHKGAGVTPQMEARLTFETDAGTNDYSMRLFHAAPDTLIFADEKYRFSRRARGGQADWRSLGAGHKESKLLDLASSTEPAAMTAKVILGIMKQCVVYQFHNTSETARMRQRWDREDNRFLKEDGANLAPFLWRLREGQPEYYRRITETIRQVAPFFADFVLEPQNGSLLLQWKERDSDMVFGAHQASDGMLRTMALIALLLQPVEDLPELIILDEPELGLHPYAINIVAGLIHAVSEHAQVILATQSMPLVNYFEPEQVVVVDRKAGESEFRRLNSQELGDWLKEYSLAELWEKNVIGGRPA